jgi:DNA sulfur modification protein DndD
MLLKSLLIKDFRQFKGKQQISFATDKNRNVTMIMGDNGTGKTSLAQVFTWCLYGETSFEDKILLCKATSASMLTNTEETVRAELTLEHSGTEYTIISEQKYRKDGSGTIRASGQRSFDIAFKKTDGTRDYVKQLDTEIRMKEILPKELSKYFFFDGERIGNMSKEIKRGRSQEFAGAVQSLLGLSAYTAALSHLKGRGNTNVLRVYESSYDAKSNSKIAEYTRQIEELSEKIENIEARLIDIDNNKEIAQDKCTDLTERIAKNKESENLAKKKADLIRKRNHLIDSKSAKTTSILRSFNNSAPSYFAKKLMKDALQALSQAEKIDKGVPNVNDKTIQFMLDRKKCICGTEILAGNDAFVSLTRLLEYIPPKSIGNMIGDFVNKCEDRNRAVKNYFDDFCDDYKFIRDFEETYAEHEADIQKIEQQLEGLESVGSLQADLSRYEKEIKTLDSEKDLLNQQKGSHSTKQKELEAARQELANKDENNRKIEIYKAYAQYMYDTLSEQYATEETKMRDDLQNTVNDLFRNIYNGGFSLSLDEKYNIQINVIDQEAGFSEDVETSTAQSISVIFAFIAGVIKMARQSQQADNAMLVSEPYPLVMDAPLSAFDKTRIKTVCEVLPAVAEQVIIFIKDTDGDLAEENLGSKVGQRYMFDKKNEFEVYIV